MQNILLQGVTFYSEILDLELAPNGIIHLFRRAKI